MPFCSLKECKYLVEMSEENESTGNEVRDMRKSLAHLKGGFGEYEDFRWCRS